MTLKTVPENEEQMIIEHYSEWKTRVRNKVTVCYMFEDIETERVEKIGEYCGKAICINQYYYLMRFPIINNILGKAPDKIYGYVPKPFDHSIKNTVKSIQGFMHKTYGIPVDGETLRKVLAGFKRRRNGR